MIDDERLRDEQREAKRAVDRNVSLDAGAGTGKTTTLTARYAEILRRELEQIRTAWDEGAVDESEAVETAASLPRRIVTTTFTERAAADLTANVREEINDRLSAVDDERGYALWRAVGDALDDGYVHTLHGLCSRLLQEHAVASTRRPTVDDDHPLAEYGVTFADLEPGFEVYEEDAAERLVRESVAAVLRENEDAEAVRTLARRWDRETVAELLYEFLTTSPRSDAYEWLRTVDGFVDGEQYAEQMVELFFRTEGVDLDRDLNADATDDVLAAARTVHALFDETRDDLHGNLRRWVVEDLVETVEDYGLHEETGEELARTDRLDATVDIVAHTMSGSGGVHDDKFDDEYPDGLDPESPLYRISAALERILAYAHEGEWNEVPSRMHALEESSYDYVEAFADVAERSFRRFAAEKRDRGVVDFSDLVLLTEHFLTSLDADERASVGFFPADGTADRATNSYVMVDEFQDTNAVQWSVVKALTSADPEDPDATNVFLVGDDKQSIYRFRGADVSVFAAAKRQLRTANERAGVDEDTAPLRTNFRTLPEPLCAINGLFDRVFPRTGATPDGADDPWYAVEDGRPAAFEARSEPLVPARENRTGDGRSIDPVVEYVPAPVDADLREAVLPPDHDLHDAPTDDGDAVEARVVANRIARLLTDGTQVYEPVDEDDPEYDALDRGDDGPVERPRDARPDDVAVLLSSRSALSAYERALRDAGVPYTVVKGSGFFETPEVKTLVNLLRVLVDPSDGVSLYGLLRSPMFGCTDEELARLAVALDDEASPSLWATLRNADEERWSSIADDLERFRSYAGAGPDARPSVDSWSTLLTRVFDETGYLAAVAADERREKAVANVEEFRDRLRALSEDGVHSLTEVLHRIERRIESGSHDPEANVVESDRGGDDSAGGAVSILTIHEAKGMEYEVVVVPAVGRNFERASGAALDETFEFETVSVGGERRPVLGIKGPDPDDRYAEASTLARELATARRRAEERAEAKRLLYVACTRARDHLVLTGQHGSADDGYPLGFAEPDPAGATTWRDWVQAVLFDDDTVDGDEGFAGAESALRTLVETGEYTRELSYDRHDGTTETGAFSVALPPESHEYRAAVDDVELRLDAFEGRGRATTGGGERALHVSPHECTSLNEGYATLGGDDGVFRVEDAGVQPGDGTRGERSAPGDLPAAVYGTLVHRLCEVRPPADAARAFARRVVEDERSSGKPIPESADVEAAISEAVAVADRARTAVEDALAGETVVASYDEYPIEATVDYDGPGLDRVELRGEIDHLAVTEEAYFLFDYKTDRPGGRDPASFVEAQTEHHRPQMLAYATALSAADPHRDVHVNLVFTEVGCRVGRLDETVDYERELFDLFAAHL